MKKSSFTSRTLTLREERALTAKEFLDLADVPPEVEWFANITNRQTRRAYQCKLHLAMALIGIRKWHSVYESTLVLRERNTSWLQGQRQENDPFLASEAFSLFEAVLWASRGQ
jgi:hypothetical protein